MPTILGWLIAFVYTVQGALTIRMPRTEKPSMLRDELRSWHYLIGLILFVLLLWRLWVWYRARPPANHGRLTPAARAWTRQLAVTTYAVLAIMPLLGIVSAWSEGLPVRIGPFFTLPALLPENHLRWMFAGYFHSAFGFAATLLTLAGLLTWLYLLLRRGTGLLAAFPPGFGFQIWTTVVITVYAFSTFRAPEPGVYAVGIFIGLTALAWGLGRLRAGRRAADGALRAAGSSLRPVALLGAVAIVAAGAYLPYATFRVTPWPVGEVIAASPGETSHAAPLMAVSIAPETDFERRVKADTYKWCRFCHTMEKGGKHLVGPNLYAIFGQRAGTVPNFYYSKAMAAAGREGLIWDEATLDKFLAGPREFVPGTSMIISSGPVKTAEERAAVINILKRETMGQVTGQSQ